jgi:hypothetical protein
MAGSTAASISVAGNGAAPDGDTRERRARDVRHADQFTLVAAAAPPDPVIERLRELDPNTMTPLAALEMLARLVTEAQQRT